MLPPTLGVKPRIYATLPPFGRLLYGVPRCACVLQHRVSGTLQTVTERAELYLPDDEKTTFDLTRPPDSAPPAGQCTDAEVNVSPDPDFTR